MAPERKIVIMKRIYDFLNENLYREMKCNSRYFHARILFLSDSIFIFISILSLFPFHFMHISFDEKWNENFKK